MVQEGAFRMNIRTFWPSPVWTTFPLCTMQPARLAGPGNGIAREETSAMMSLHMDLLAAKPSAWLSMYSTRPELVVRDVANRLHFEAITIQILYDTVYPCGKWTKLRDLVSFLQALPCTVSEHYASSEKQSFTELAGAQDFLWEWLANVETLTERK